MSTCKEELIRTIEHCVGDGLCHECRYKGHMACKSFLLSDILTMLKNPESAEIEIEGDSKNTWWHVCSECRTPVDDNDKFCKNCGRRFKSQNVALTQKGRRK